MAVVWEKTEDDRRYRVTRAGASVRLYTNGVFHSQYNPNQPVGGNLWDLLLLPAFMHPQPQALKRVLILGVGGGAVIRQLNVFLQPDQLTGVDMDETHLYVAKHFFDIKSSSVTLVHAEAHGWLEAYDGEPFDLIIEDLFIGRNGTGQPADPVRAIAADKRWFGLLLQHLHQRGVLVMNFESRHQLLKSTYRHFMSRRGGITAAYHLTAAQYENAVGAFLREPMPARHFVEHLRRFNALDQRRKACRLKFSYRKLPAC